MIETVFEWAGRKDLPEDPSPLRTVLYVNAHCLSIASTDSSYHRLLNRADLVYPDGISVVWAGRWLGSACLHKITGADWINNVCEGALNRGLRLYILAGKPGVPQAARAALLKRYPGLEIVGACDGFFIEKNEADVLNEINQTAPDIIFVGMGAPLQEKWIAAHRLEIHAPVCWAVGALFDYVAGVEPRVPAWLNSLAMEWLWRLLIDPAGKWRRYLIGNPLFLYRILRQKLKS